VKAVYQIKINLLNMEPPIWRRVVVPGHLRLHQLHKVIQLAMGWQGTQPHEFYHYASERYFMPLYDLETAPLEKGFDERTITLAELCPNVDDDVSYMYDLGDGWQHHITVEKITETDTDDAAPRCLDGLGACPPEKSGGPTGFARLLEILADRRHPEHEEMLAWCGETFDPEVFETDEVNKVLAEVRWTRFHFVDHAEKNPDQWPESTAAEVLALLRDPHADHEELLTALRLGGDPALVSDAFLQEMLRLLKPSSTNPEITMNAALAVEPVLQVTALGRVEDLGVAPDMIRAVLAALRRLVETPAMDASVRRAAMESAACCPGPWMPAAVREAFASPDGAWRQSAVFCMGFLEGFGKELAAARQDAEANVRWEAVRSMKRG